MTASLKRQWVPCKMEFLKRDMDAEFLINQEGKVLIRLRKSMIGDDTHAYRLYNPPVYFGDASDHDSTNFFARGKISGKWSSEDLRKTVEVILNEHIMPPPPKLGVLRIVKPKVKTVKKTKTSKSVDRPKKNAGVRQIPGPHGGVRYISLATGKIVPTPR